MDGISSSNLIATEKSNITVDHRKSNDLNITVLVTKPYRDPTTKQFKLTKVKRDDSGWDNCKVILLDQNPVASLNGAWYHLDVFDLPIDQHSHAMRLVESNGISPKPFEEMKGNMKSSYSKRSEMKIVYKITNGYSCGGIPIRQWKDGTHAKWGMHKGLSNCKNECNQHTECKGFVAVHSTGVCGHWKSGPLRLTEKFGKDRDCYMKKMKRYVKDPKQVKVKNRMKIK